jgi:hypothetical protein
MPVYLMWVAVQTQWQWATDGMGSRRVGLSYPGVRAAPAFVALRGRRQREAMLADLCIMESAWLNEHERQRRYQASKAQQPAIDSLPG